MNIETVKHGKVFFGLHMAPGVAQYKEPGKEPLTIFINEKAIKEMDSTFPGKPVYVHHVDEVDLKDLNQVDGWVVESFFNKADGKHWCKFVVVSDEGLQAIQNGWKLSNAYFPESYGPEGEWHGVDYQKEVMSGRYEHLAIVPNPRYTESVILTVEEFKAYNNAQETELTRLANSKGDSNMFFKRTKVENSADLENTMVTLPKSKQDITISKAVELADKLTNMAGYASPEHMVKCNDDEEMTVNDMVKKYNDMKAEKADMEAKKNAAEEEEKKKNAEMSEEDKAKKNAEDEEKKKKDEEEAKKNEEDKKKSEEDKKANALALETLKNAGGKGITAQPLMLSSDKVALGKQRYGSNK